MKQSVTIREVAAAAKVSIATVSRVLSNEMSVTKDKRERVKAAIEQLHYIPNLAARQMHGQGERTIGVVTTRTSGQAFGNPYFSEVIGAIGSVTEQNDYNLQINSFDSTETELEKVMCLYRNGRVNGFILLSSRTYDPLICFLAKEDIPFVIVGRVIENTVPDHESICWVNTDNVLSSKNAVERLIEQGHRHIAIMTGPMKYVVSQDRYMGYRQALLTHSLPFRESYCISAGYLYEDAKAAVRAVLAQNPELTAIFATDDLKGVAVIETLTELGIRVPEEIAVIGHDDFDISRIIRPALTTVHVPIHDLGLYAAQMLIERIEKGDVEQRHKILQTRLIGRDSG